MGCAAHVFVVSAMVALSLGAAQSLPLDGTWRLDWRFEGEGGDRLRNYYLYGDPPFDFTRFSPLLVEARFGIGFSK